MFVRGERVDTLRRPTAATPASGRPRYCRRCGGPVALSASAINGARCLNCGFQPGLPVAGNPHSPPRDFTVPRRLTPVPIEPDRPSWDTVARPSVPPNVRAVRPIVDVVKLRAWLIQLRAWLMDRSPPSARTLITTAAAGVGVVVGITVAMTLG